MISHILAEIVGTFVYVGSHHITQSNPLITSLALFTAMSLLNQFAGNVGVSLNPLASFISFLTKEQPFTELVVLVFVQIFAVLVLFYVLKTFKISTF